MNAATRSLSEAREAPPGVGQARIRPADWLLSSASGVLLVAAQPPWSLQALGWIALVPLLLALDRKRSGRRILLGLLCGTIWSWGLVGRWLWPAARAALPVNGWATLAITGAGVEVFGGLYVAFFCWLVGPLRRRFTLRAPFFVAALWVALELLRAHAFGGAPWGLLGHSQWAETRLIQIADASGVYGVSFLLVTANTSLAGLLRALFERRRRSRAIAGLAGSAVLVAVALGYGTWRLGGASASGTFPVQVVYSAWDGDGTPAARSLLQRLIDLTDGVPPGASLVVWPENSLRSYIVRQPDAASKIAAMTEERDQYLLAGGPRYKRTVAGNLYYNTAYLFRPSGQIAHVHDKHLLVPLAESHFGFFPSVKRTFRAGRGWKPWTVGAANVGTLICFEAIFSGPARALVRAGANVLVNISNDHLVGVGASQQAAMAVFRAVENRVSLLRVSNFGSSLLVDPLGRVEARRSGAGTAVWDVPLGLAGTLYTRWGDVFALACAAFAWLGLAVAVWSPRTNVRT